MRAHISYTADTGEKLVNETYGPNNIRRRTSGTADLRTVDSFLGSSERRRADAAHLDDDQCARRAGVDRDRVNLVAADFQVARHDAPAAAFQVVSGLLLRGRAA